MISNLLLVLLFPLLGVVLSPLSSTRKVGVIAFVFSLITLASTLITLENFNPVGGMQFIIDYAWLPQLGISFKLGVDGISILLVLLTNVLVPLILLSSFGRKIENAKAFYGLILLMQFALIGVFTSLDGFLFYIFWELALIPIYFICLLWGGKDRIRITLKFFIYTLSGSLLMLVGLVYLYLQTPGTHTFDLQALYDLQLSSSQQTFVFWMIFLAFAIKIPIFPLHSWQPDTYTDAPTQGTMLLSGIMLKMGIYGVMRWLIPVVPAAVVENSLLVLSLCVIGIVYASCIAIVQKDYKRLIAYSSIAHVGLITAGVFTLTQEGMEGAVFQMLSHGINAVGLFFVAEIITSRLKTRNLDELGGIANNHRTFTILFLIIMLGAVALPLTNGFVGEFLLLAGLYKIHPYMSLFAGLSVVLGAVYMLRSYQKIMLGSRHVSENEFEPLTVSEKTVLVTIAAIIIITCVYPKMLMDVAAPSVTQLINIINAG